ncbi:hypothetical protein TRVL_07642 [Trypanosoma vivax]|nr:hypothetical protein TRVL_07642 [Trypanosoma vivax]
MKVVHTNSSLSKWCSRHLNITILVLFKLLYNSETRQFFAFVRLSRCPCHSTAVVIDLQRKNRLYSCLLIAAQELKDVKRTARMVTQSTGMPHMETATGHLTLKHTAVRYSRSSNRTVIP